MEMNITVANSDGRKSHAIFYISPLPGNIIEESIRYIELYLDRISIRPFSYIRLLQSVLCSTRVYVHIVRALQSADFAPP